MFFLELGALAIFVIILSQASMRVERWKIEREEEEKKSRAEDEKYAYAKIRRRFGTDISRGIDGIANAFDAYREQQKRHDRERAFREKCTIIALIVAAVAASLSLWVFYRQLGEMQAEQRPWITLVGVPVITSNLDLTPMPGFPKISGGFDGVSLNFDLTVRNIGHSPARRVSVVANFVQATEPNPLEAQRKMCAQFEQPTPTEGITFETTLFPDDKHTFQRSASFGFISKLRNFNKGGKAIFRAVVVGCVNYMFGDEHHQTGFIFDLGKKMPVETNRADFWANFWLNLDDAPFRPEDLMFIPDEMGTGPAN